MSEWQSKTLAELVTISKGRQTRLSDSWVDGYEPYLGAEAIAGKPVKRFAEKRLALLAYESDILMLWDGERSGLVGRHLSGVVSSTVVRLSPRPGIDSAYLFYALQSKFNWIQLQRTGTGVPHVPKDIHRALRVDLPDSTASQSAIAAVLSTVDEAIEQTEALIAKSQQIKAGMMHDLFTRGLTPEGKLRPPRVEAPDLYKQSPVGWIPRDWTAICFGECLMEKPQNGLYKPGSLYGDSGTPIVRIDSYDRGEAPRMGELRRVSIASSDIRLYSLAKGDILVNRVNSIDYVGKSTLMPDLVEAVVFESNMMRCRVASDRLLPSFAIEWLGSHAARRHFYSCAKSAIAQASINQRDVASLNVAAPSIAEQTLIVEMQDSAKRTIGSNKHRLAKLRSLKAALMHDLLTGRVRVPVSEDAP